MQVKKQFKGYKNYGDINFMEHGGRFIKQVDIDTYYIVTIDLVIDYDGSESFLGEIKWLIEHTYIDITDSWIDLDRVKSFIGLDKITTNKDKELLADGILTYHGTYHCNGISETVSGIKKAYSLLKTLLDSEKRLFKKIKLKYSKFYDYFNFYHSFRTKVIFGGITYYGTMFKLCDSVDNTMKDSMIQRYNNIKWYVVQLQYAPEIKKACLFISDKPFKAVQE
jgi:hypothetical protein